MLACFGEDEYGRLEDRGNDNVEKTYVSMNQDAWLRYFESSPEEQSNQMFAVAVSIFWSRGKLHRDGWTEEQVNRVGQLLNEIGLPALANQPKLVTIAALSETDPSLASADKLTELRKILDEVSRAKSVLDRMLTDDAVQDRVRFDEEA